MGHRKSFVSVLENLQVKILLAICLGVYTVGCVNSLKVKFFRYVAMNRHIKSVRFTTKIRKTRNIRPCFSNSGDNTAVSQLCNFSYKTTLLPPKQCSCWTYIYARILNWVAFIVLPSSSIGWHLSCYHPPMHAYSVGWHLSCYHLPSSPDYFLIFLLCMWSVNVLHVALITHRCGIFACITILLKKKVG